MNRRSFLRLAAAACAAPRLGRAAAAQAGDAFLEDLQQRSFSYFEEKADNGTGLVLDRACTNGGPYSLDARPTASTSVTGFGLAAFCVAAERGWLPRARALARVRATLRFFADRAPQERGWFYHWLHLRTGERAGAFSNGRGNEGISEISTIDTALLLAGMLTARAYFASDPEVVRLATAIYERVDFAWMLQPGTGLLSHGWTPESGFLPFAWDEYSEAGLLYLLAIASPTHPIPPRAWYAWRRTPNAYAGYRYVGTTPLFTFQYSHAFFAFSGRRDRGGVDWAENSRTATLAHRRFCADLHGRFPGYTGDIWGITPSRSAAGYTDWGGPPLDPRTDGTIVPAAAGGSLMFAPEICVPALQAMRARYPASACRYGFTDSFNPCTGWYSPDVTGLNLGITLLAAENLRSGSLWRWFMSNPEAERALARAQFTPSAGPAPPRR